MQVTSHENPGLRLICLAYLSLQRRRVTKREAEKAVNCRNASQSSGSPCNGHGYFPRSRSVMPLESDTAIRVALAVPAIASRKLCICGVNSRRSASFWAKENTQ